MGVPRKVFVRTTKMHSSTNHAARCFPYTGQILATSRVCAVRISCERSRPTSARKERRTGCLNLDLALRRGTIHAVITSIFAAMTSEKHRMQANSRTFRDSFLPGYRHEINKSNVVTCAVFTPCSDEVRWTEAKRGGGLNQNSHMTNDALSIARLDAN